MPSNPFVPHPAPQPKYPVPITKDNLLRIFGEAGDFTLRQVLARTGQAGAMGLLY